MSDATIDLGTFNELKETAGADFIQELVQTFLEEAPAMLQELRDSLAAEDANTFRRAAHSLKSNSMTFGALRLGGMSRELELNGFAASASPNTLDALEQEYARVATTLAELSHG